MINSSGKNADKDDKKEFDNAVDDLNMPSGFVF